MTMICGRGLLVLTDAALVEQGPWKVPSVFRGAHA